MSPFHSYMTGGGTGPNPWDEVLLETEGFVVVPTRGAIVEGWLLVVPRVNVLSFGHLPKALREGRDAVVAATVRAVQRVYGRADVFEHGPARWGSVVGCTVDHAHLHVLPAPCDLLEGAAALLPDAVWGRGLGLDGAAPFASSGEPYLYCDVGGMGNGRYGRHPSIPSQLFRRVVASAVGEPDRYDWRQHPRPTSAAATADALREALPVEFDRVSVLA